MADDRPCVSLNIVPVKGDGPLCEMCGVTLITTWSLFYIYIFLFVVQGVVGALPSTTVRNATSDTAPFPVINQRYVKLRAGQDLITN